MRIAIDVRMIHSSGIGVYIQNLVPRIMRLRKKDFFYLLGSFADREDPIWKDISNHEWLECESRIYSLRQQWELPRKIPKDTDLLWVPHYDIPIFFRGRLMVTIHDLFHLAMPQFAGGLHKRVYARWMFKQAAQKASVIDVISQFTKDEWIRLVGTSESKIRVIHNGVDESWFNVQPLGMPHPKPYFLYVGNIKPHKNLKRLLEAHRIIQDQVPHDLLLVGKKAGFLKGDPEVQKMAASFEGRVQFTGEVAVEELKQFFAQAEALVFPSLYEGFGLPPLEAMASGCPVIASKAASIPEVCGNAALYFDPFDARDMAAKMIRIIREKPLRQELVAKGKAVARGFSWETCAERTSALLDETLKKS